MTPRFSTPFSRPLGLSALALLLSLAPTFSATFDWQAPPEADHVAAFRLFVPDDLPKARAVIVLVPGFNGDGRNMAADPAWQALAQRTQSALLACSLQGKSGGVYYIPAKWSGDVLLKALTELAAISHHPEIATAPLAFWGHSAGGQFNYNFACWQPERTLAFVANKGAYYASVMTPQVCAVPALWIMGALDKDIRINHITAHYEDGRRQNALWALVVEPGLGHDVGRSKELGIAFLEDAIALRLDAHGKLQPADPAKGWLGDLSTHEVAKNLQSDAGPSEKSWFPAESTAKLWRDVVTPKSAP